MVLHLTNTDEQPVCHPNTCEHECLGLGYCIRLVPKPLARFFAEMWALFIDGCSIDGCDLDEAIEKSRLGERREATQEDVDRTSMDLDIGDDILVLTSAGRAAIEAAKRAA